MPEFLVFQLQAALCAWGEPAVGEYRGTADTPSLSALCGLLGAALGLQRTDEPAHAALRDGYGFAVGLQCAGTLLRDYHTAQVPPRAALRGRPHRTRRDELQVPKRDLATILSDRDYRQDAACLVAVQPRAPGPPPYVPDALARALARPRYSLYLGRKSCPPAAPLWPQVIEAEDAMLAFQRYRDQLAAARQGAAQARGVLPLEPCAPVRRILFDDYVQAGPAAQLPRITTRRKDRVIHRGRWQFGDRDEHAVWIDGED